MTKYIHSPGSKVMTPFTLTKLHKDMYIDVLVYVGIIRPTLL